MNYRPIRKSDFGKTLRGEFGDRDRNRWQHLILEGRKIVNLEKKFSPGPRFELWSPVYPTELPRRITGPS
jgi:hypothetical protein